MKEIGPRLGQVSVVPPSPIHQWIKTKKSCDKIVLLVPSYSRIIRLSYVEYWSQLKPVYVLNFHKKVFTFTNLWWKNRSTSKMKTYVTCSGSGAMRPFSTMNLLITVTFCLWYVAIFTLSMLIIISTYWQKRTEQVDNNNALVVKHTGAIETALTSTPSDSYHQLMAAKGKLGSFRTPKIGVHLFTDLNEKYLTE